MTMYTWTIESSNADDGTMIVSYAHNGKTTELNLPAPDLGADISVWVDKFAPRSRWDVKPVNEIVIGTTGEGAVALPAADPSAAVPPQLSGSVNEEYLRALIFQVIEEINAAAV